MLSVSPRASMFDAPVVISASQLEPKQKVTIRGKVDHASGKFQSHARFVADNNGNLNLSTEPALGGSYEGVHPMGLFTTLEQSPGQKLGLRLMPRTVDQPMNYSFEIINGHGDVTNNAIIARTTAERHFIHPAVERREIEIGRLRGSLFCLKNFSGKQPAIIDIYGTGGGLLEHRAALLSSKGFAVFSLAFFDYKDLPKTLGHIELNYFEEAIDWLSSLPNTSDRIGFIGTSLGGAIAVLAGIHYPKLRAVVPINCFHMLDSFNPVSVNGIPFHTASGDLQHLDLKDGILRYSSFLGSIPTSEELVFRIENCSKDTYWHFLTGGDDRACCSEKSARILEKRLIDAGMGDQVQVSILKNTGHLLDPPFMPYCEKSWHKHVGAYMMWGGDKYNQAKGQDEMWTKLIAFLSDKLGAPPEMPSFSSAMKKSSL